MSYALRKISFSSVKGWNDEDFLEAFVTFQKSCEQIVNGRDELRPALQSREKLQKVARTAMAQTICTNNSAKSFFQIHFTPYIIQPRSETRRGFVTGYYEPMIDASEEQSIDFNSPILSRPDDLETFTGDMENWPLGPDFSGGRKRNDGSWQAYPTRGEIESGDVPISSQPIAFVRDEVEAYMIHVQGSARLKMRNGQIWRLTYAGRNGRPYSSIGKYLLEQGAMTSAEMSLSSLKAWLRANGLKVGQRARNALWRNESFVFFDVKTDMNENSGPIGGQGLPLTPLRSIAVDRTIWPYGLPFWLSAENAWKLDSNQKFQRLMIAQDTGSAIVGAARADIYFGTGDAAGYLAGNVRHACDFVVLLPN